jgi:hypothetical protein
MRVHRNCCGLDVHKKIIAACLIRGKMRRETASPRSVCSEA